MPVTITNRATAAFERAHKRKVKHKSAQDQTWIAGFVVGWHDRARTDSRPRTVEEMKALIPPKWGTVDLPTDPEDFNLERLNPYDPMADGDFAESERLRRGG